MGLSFFDLPDPNTGFFTYSLSWGSNFFALPNTGFIIRYNPTLILDSSGRPLEYGTQPHFFNRPGLDALETVLELIEETPPVEPRSILIEGCERFVERTEAALDVIRRHPSYYDFVRRYLRIIRQLTHLNNVVPRTGITVQYPPTYWVSSATYLGSRYWYAGVIIHEAAHSWQYWNGRPHSGYIGEWEALEIQIEFLIHVEAPNDVLTWAKGWRGRRWW